MESPNMLSVHDYVPGPSTYPEEMYMSWLPESPEDDTLRRYWAFHNIRANPYDTDSICSPPPSDHTEGTNDGKDDGRDSREDNGNHNINDDGKETREDDWNDSNQQDNGEGPSRISGMDGKGFVKAGNGHSVWQAQHADIGTHVQSREYGRHRSRRLGGSRGGRQFIALTGNQSGISTSYPGQAPQEHKASDNNDETQVFRPRGDFFNTGLSFVLHLSIPGARMEDVRIEWDAAKSELSIVGFICRPGQLEKEFLKTLTKGEREVGPFKRTVIIPTISAQINVERISARLDDGVLQIDVPKMKMKFVEVKKVDIE